MDVCLHVKALCPPFLCPPFIWSKYIMQRYLISCILVSYQATESHAINRATRPQHRTGSNALQSFGQELVNRENVSRCTANTSVVRIELIENERVSKRRQTHGLASRCPGDLRASRDGARSVSLQRHAATGLANGATSVASARSLEVPERGATCRVPPTFGRTPIRGRIPALDAGRSRRLPAPV